jgi:DNA-binding transcriptional regulator LsrR (DeoR family)
MPRPKRPKPTPFVMKQAAKLFARHEDYQVIAQRLGMNRRDIQPLMEQSVSWLLQQQARLGRRLKAETVQDRLEQKVLKRFPHLLEVKIVPCGKIRNEAQYAALVREWGVHAAEYLDRLAEDAERLNAQLQVGVSGGETVLEVMSQLPERDRSTTEFHALALIGRGQLLDSFHVGPETNATIGWSRSGRIPGKCHYGTVPPYALELAKLSAEERRRVIADELDDLAKTDAIRKVISGMNQLDLVFAGLGLVNPSETDFRLDRLTMTGLLKPLGIEPHELSAEGAVGDICCCLFNKDGEEQPKNARRQNLPKERWRFFLTAGHYLKHSGVDFYRDLALQKKVVVVIAGIHKEAAIKAALKGKLFNYWITDDETARYVLAV